MSWPAHFAAEAVGRAAAGGNVAAAAAPGAEASAGFFTTEFVATDDTI